MAIGGRRQRRRRSETSPPVLARTVVGVPALPGQGSSPRTAMLARAVSPARAFCKIRRPDRYALNASLHNIQEDEGEKHDSGPSSSPPVLAARTGQLSTASVAPAGPLCRAGSISGAPAGRAFRLSFNMQED